jgi:hypothetical protein
MTLGTVFRWPLVVVDKLSFFRGRFRTKQVCTHVVNVLFKRNEHLNRIQVSLTICWGYVPEKFPDYRNHQFMHKLFFSRYLRFSLVF